MKTKIIEIFGIVAGIILLVLVLTCVFGCDEEPGVEEGITIYAHNDYHSGE